MKIRRFLSVFLLSCLLCTLFTPQALALEDPDIRAKAALLVDADTGTILYDKNCRAELPMASITKVMSALLVLEAVDRGQLRMEQEVTATQSAMKGMVEDGSTADIKVGETLTWDIYLITREAMKHDDFMTIVNTKAYTVPITNITDTERELHSTNALISNWRMTGYLYSGAQGIKTGSTDAAGLCLVSSAVRGSRTLISVVLGCEEVKTETGGTRVESFSETARMFDWGFDNFSTRTVLEENELIREVPVALSNEVSTVAVHPAYTAEAVLPNDLELDQLERVVTLNAESVDAPVAAGDALGSITIRYDGTDYVTVPLLAVADVSASRFLLAKRAIGEFFSRTPVKIAVVVILLLAAAAFAWFRLYGRSRRYGKASSKHYRHHAYRGRRR